MRTQPYVIPKGQGWVYRFGLDFAVKSSEIQAGSGVAILEYTTRRDEEPPDHTHATEDEMFYVLEGALTFHCGGQSFEVMQGGFIFLPRGIEHGYKIDNDAPVRLLVITAPARDGLSGGWGGFVSDLELGQGELVATPSAASEG
ncbi:MAG: cupin domain-containing protein [Caldilineaceae bacterium]